MTPPKIRFLTRIYHPNIDRLGRICLDVLKNNWSPALQIRTILLSIQALLGAPNPEDPLNEAVAKQWKVSANYSTYARHMLTWCCRRIKQKQSRLHANGRSCTRNQRNDTFDESTKECVDEHISRLMKDRFGGVSRTELAPVCGADISSLTDGCSLCWLGSCVDKCD